MGFVFGAEARQLHADQIGKRDQPDSFNGVGCRNSGCGFGILGTHLLAGEDQVHRPSRRGLGGLHQHVHSAHVPVAQAEWLDGQGDLLDIFAANDDVDVACQASRVGLGFFDVEIDGQTTNHAVFQSRNGKGRLDTAG